MIYSFRTIEFDFYKLFDLYTDNRQFKEKIVKTLAHSLIRGVLIQSCSAGAKNCTDYVFCHPQFSGVILNIENLCAIKAKILKNQFLLYKIDYFDNNRHRQT